ncbi:MAG TPA: response regulator transcription factor [Candidatus Angelobacter sp.]|nr:response regulator transcription factor [Candidatus Angelobacter sp.]
MKARGDNPFRVHAIAASSARRAELAEMVSEAFPSKITSSSAATLESAIQSGAEIVLIDAEGPSAAEAAIRIAEGLPGGTGAVILIDHPGTRWIARALAAEVNAILSRDISADDLQLAFMAANAGFLLLHPTSAASLMSQAPKDLPDDSLEIEHLTGREQEVLRLLSGGLGNKEIAGQLNISEHTVKFHISSILGKLHATSRTEAVSQGIKRGLIPI